MTRNDLCNFGFNFSPFAVTPKHSPVDWVDRFQEIHQTSVVAAVTDQDWSKPIEDLFECTSPFAGQSGNLIRITEWGQEKISMNLGHERAAQVGANVASE